MPCLHGGAVAGGQKDGAGLGSGPPGISFRFGVMAWRSSTLRKPAGTGTVRLARFCAVGGSQAKSAACRKADRPALLMTTRTGRYVLGLTQMVSEIRLPDRLFSSIAWTPSTACRPATARDPQETAARSSVATVAGSELA